MFRFRENFENLDRTYIEEVPAILRSHQRKVTDEEMKETDDFWANEFKRVAKEANKEESA